MAKSSRDDRRDRKPGRIARAKARAPSRPWGVLVAANALPVMIALIVGVLWAKGSIEFAPGSENVLPSLIVLGVTLVLLVVIAWIIAPALFPMVKRTREFVDRNITLMLRGGPGAISLRLVYVIAGVVAYGVLWANLVVLGLLVLVDVAAIIASFTVFVREVLKAKG